jgi:hypothetical protein
MTYTLPGAKCDPDHPNNDWIYDIFGGREQHKENLKNIKRWDRVKSIERIYEREYADF